MRIFLFLISSWIFSFDTFSQLSKTIPVDLIFDDPLLKNIVTNLDQNHLYDQCKVSIENNDFELAKKTFNLLAKDINQNGLNTSFNKLPSLFFQAGIMSISNDKKSTINFFWNAAVLYEHFFGSKNIFIPTTIKKIGDYLFQLKDYANAITYYKSSIDSLLKFTSDHYTSCTIRIGICYLQLNHFLAAEKIFNKTISECLEAQEIDSVSLFYLYNNLGTVYARDENFSTADSIYQTALQYISTNQENESLSHAFIINNLGNLKLEKKDYKSALEFYLIALNIREPLLPKKSIELIQSYNNIGYCYSLLDMQDSALVYSQKSLLSNSLILKSTNFFENPNKWDCISDSDLLTSMLDKGEYLIKLHQKDSNSVTLDLAQSTLLGAKELFNSVEENIFSFKSKLAWSSRNERLSNLLIKVGYLQYDSTKPTWSLLPEVDFKRTFIHHSYSIIKESLCERSNEYSLLEQNKQIIYLMDSGIQSKKRLSDFSNYFKFDTIIPQRQVSIIDKNSIALIQSKLNDNQGIVSFAICDSLIIRHIISNHSIAFQPINLPELKAISNQHLKHLKTFGDYTITGKQLYKILLKDIEKDLDQFNELIIIPDEFLFNLPFETFIVNDSEKLLIDRYNISYAFSLSSLLKETDSSLQDNGFIGFSPIGNNLFSLNKFRNELSAKLNENLKLKYADQEIDKISELFLSTRTNTIKNFGFKASIEEFMSVEDTFSFIHIATHNIVNSKNPWMTYMLFHPDSSFPDGKLYLPIIYSLGTKANCLILSGCGTGMGTNSTNEGILSVAHAFSCNPIGNLVLSLWNIDDEYTSEFMVDLYGEIINQKSIGRSLSEIKRERIKSSLNHPFFWSSILHYYNSL